MKLGLLTDVHEHVEHLQTALSSFHHAGVDQIIHIGDVFGLGKQIEETCNLLEEAGVQGVWGNHDFGLCCEPDDALKTRYGPSVMRYMARLQPRLEIAGCQFSHVEPWLDPYKLEDLWYFEGIPNTPEKLSRIFQASSHRIFFCGHFHRWLLATPQELTDWSGRSPISLALPNRYFCIIGALCLGRWAVFDTDTCLLMPWNTTQNDD